MTMVDVAVVTAASARDSSRRAASTAHRLPRSPDVEQDVRYAGHCSGSHRLLLQRSYRPALRFAGDLLPAADPIPVRHNRHWWFETQGFSSPLLLGAPGSIFHHMPRFPRARACPAPHARAKALQVP
eukprot:1778517-Rhodomonas_salina.2